MTEYRRGDVVLISFIFTDESGERRRPAVIVSSDTYHSSRQEAIVAAVTSRTDRILAGDHIVGDWQRAGLLFPSIATGIIRTVKRGVIARKLGTMPHADMRAIENNLRDILQLKDGTSSSLNTSK
ncbi:MAG: type II toxin-antitoxin system PemK/MazF family toxin [Chloroflexi bacterium]|nr:type II toxin-antitoxin system PemK/MazF family toxin [Chloroflexota bacterium]